MASASNFALTMNAAQYHFEHTRKRLLERHALDITYREYMHLCVRCAVQEDVAIASKKIGGTYQVYRVKFKKRSILVAFETHSMLITTVLPQ